MRFETESLVPSIIEEVKESFAELTARPALASAEPQPLACAITARFEGFDLDDRPLLTGLPGLGHEVVTARSTTPLCMSDIGATVVALCEEGNARKPIILGVVLDRPVVEEPELQASRRATHVSVRRDDETLVLSAERQIVLKCGDASITLTRAGKVLIDGSYVLSRSSGYNKIKGAAVDIN